jgi:AcrR family transcriptional regulator
VESGPARDPAAQRREQILAAALRLFRNQGFDRTSLREIAESLGLSKSGLYHYFSAKDDLLDAVVAPLLDRVEALLARSPAELTTLTQRQEFLTAYVDILIAHRDVASLLGNDMGVLGNARIGGRVSNINTNLYLRLTGPAADVATTMRVTHALVGLQAIVVRFTQADPAVLRDIALRAASASLAA